MTYGSISSIHALQKIMRGYWAILGGMLFYAPSC